LDLPEIYLGRDLLSDINKSLSKEWLVTNGLGGYSSSTVLGVNTRKYHGLLVAAFTPPVNRWVILTKLDETLDIGNEHFDIHANEFKDVIYPEGYNFLSTFDLDPFPTYTYIVGGVILKKKIFMPYMKNATAVIYSVSNLIEEKVTFKTSPLINSRHIYNTTDKNRIEWSFKQKHNGNAVIIEPTDPFSALILSSSDNGSFINESWWIEKMFFRVDASRSENSLDDNFRPGYFKFSIDPKESKTFYFLAVAGKTLNEAQKVFPSFDNETKEINNLYNEALTRRKVLLNCFQKHKHNLQLDDWLKWLIQATDAFIVFRASTGKKSVIAGYHWFDDWGRDSLISLPGLTLVTGRYDDAKEILITFECNCRNGIIPNRFSDKAGDIPLYNTVDATLWFFNAVLQYLKYTGDYEFVQKNLWNTLKKIIDHHVKGTIFGIHVDQDGLISHGPQLTWMDAATISGFVTPRDGKAVEIQALWYNALKIMELLSRRFHEKDNIEIYNQMAEKVKESFLEQFWSVQHNYLFDVVNNDGNDSTLRPNQLIALSLDFSMLDKEKSDLIIDTVWRQLWGVYGLKTLPRNDSRYFGRYLGNWGHRDQAYHNGTVWTWLLGPFVTAFLKLKGYKASWRDFAFKNFMYPLVSTQLFEAGLATFSEIFDGNEPHLPRGCIAQAWSVAETLRAYIEDIALIRPPNEAVILKSYWQ
jgi:predicted glycogen debranching enzyme